MPVSTFVDEFTVLSTDVVGTTYVRTGYGFQPQAAIVFACLEGAADAVSGNDVHWAIGFAANPTQRESLAYQSIDAVAISDTTKRRGVASVSETINNAGGLTGALDLNSFDSDGATFIVDDQFPFSRRPVVWAIGGSDITNTFVGSLTLGAATGNESVTGVGFRPDVVFFHCTASTGVSSSQAVQGIGYMTVAGKQGTISTKSLDASTPSSTRRYNTDLECISTIAAGTGQTVARRAAFVSMDGDGFTINHLETSAASTFTFLCIKGGTWRGGNFSTLNDTVTPIVVIGLGGTPRGILAWSHGTTESTQDTEQTEAFLAFGAASGPTNRVSTGFHDRDAQAVTQTSRIIEHDELLALVDSDLIGFLVDITSMDSDGFTAIMDDADDGRNAFVQFIAVTDNQTVPGNQQRRKYERWNTRSFP